MTHPGRLVQSSLFLVDIGSFDVHYLQPKWLDDDVSFWLAEQNRLPIRCRERPMQMSPKGFPIVPRSSMQTLEHAPAFTKIGTPC